MKTETNFKLNFHQIIDKLKGNKLNTIEIHIKNRKIKKTYDELHEDILRMLSYLSGLNISQEDKIGILCDNSYEYVLIDLACIVGGIKLFSFHKSQIDDNIVDILELYGLKKVFHDIIDLHNINKGFVFLNEQEIQNILNLKPCDIQQYQYKDDDVFTVVFTSGTTGIPKAIEIKVNSVEEFLNSFNDKFHFKVDDKIIDFLPLSIFTSRLYLYGAVLMEINIVVTTTEFLIGSLRIYQPTFLQAVPYFFESIYKNIIREINQSVFKKLGFFSYRMLRKVLPTKLNRKIQKRMFYNFYEFWGGKMKYLITGSAPISTKVLKFYNILGINIYEAYGITEVGLLTLNYPGVNKIGSVGKKHGSKEIKIAPNGEILVKSDYFFADKYLDPEEKKQNKSYLKDGYFYTGDVGYLDKEGFLYIKGRIKEIITLSNGEKVFPPLIENMLNSCPFFKQTIAIGDDKPFIICILVITQLKIQEEQIRLEINKVNKSLPDYAKINKYLIISDEFTIENKLLSNNTKLNRTEINNLYRKQIEQLYA